MSNKALRIALRSALANSNSYDPASLRIHRDGTVSAMIDPDKTGAHISHRFSLGTVDEVLATFA